MAHSNGRIYIDPNTTGVEVADVQQVLGRGVGDVGLLCSDQEWYLDHIDPVTLEPVYLTRPTNKINPLAKYKPVQHQKVGLLSLAERASTRFGFGAALSKTLTLTDASPRADWEYEKPRGMAQNEWFRLRDFEGYSHGACSPLAVMVGQLVNDGESQILLFGNGMSNAARTDGRTWIADQSLSLAELLASGSQSAIGYYISFLLVDKTAQDHAKTLIVTNKTMTGFINGEHGYYEFKIYADGSEGYPAIPLLQSSNRYGNTFEVIACLMPGGPSSGNYVVYDSDTQGFLGFQPYSLGFVSGCDRTERTLGSGAFRLDGLVVDSVTVSYVDMITEITYNGYVYRAFSVQVAASLNTMDADAWSGTEMTVLGTLTITNGNSFIFGPSPDPNDGGDSQIEVGTATSVVSKRSGQNKWLFSAGSDNYLWVMKYNGALLSTTVTASVVFSEPLDTPTTPKSGTTTIS